MLNFRTGVPSPGANAPTAARSEDDTKAARELRLACRAQRHTGPTQGLADQFVQCNVVILPERQALGFLLFCLRNPRGCPLIDVLDAGAVKPNNKLIGDDFDVRTDLPKYSIYENGKAVKEVAEVKEHWRPDLVTFLLGCSFSWDMALSEIGLAPRHVEENSNVSMYVCSRVKNVVAQIAYHPTDKTCGANDECPAKFGGQLVVSMRPYKEADIEKVRALTAQYPGAHGAPVGWGYEYASRELGIRDLRVPDYGCSVEIREGELPVFWACGVTSQQGIASSRVPFAITHAPGHMLVTDLWNEDLKC